MTAGMLIERVTYGPIGVLGSALPEQWTAIQDFQNLALTAPNLAMQALSIQIGETTVRRPARKVQAAISTLHRLFDSFADTYMVLGDEVDNATAHLRDAWRNVNHLTGAEDKDTAAKLEWRRARVRTYLGLVAHPDEA